MFHKILCLCLFISMAGVSFCQELDEKMPLKEEEEEISVLTGTETIQTGTPTIQEEDVNLPSEPETTSSPDVTTTTTLESQELKGTVTTIEVVGTTGLDSGTRTPVGSSTQEIIPATITLSAGTQTTAPLSGTLTIGTVTAEPGTDTLLDTGLMLIPTAYRRDDKLGFNTDFLIAYYIGELWYKYKYDEGRKKDSGLFEPIKFLFLSADFKFSLLKEKTQIPNVGCGYEWFLVLQGAASTPAQMGGEFSGKSDRFGFPYLIFSKEFKNKKYHLGVMSGEIGKLVNPLSKYMAVTSNKTLIFGFETKLFNRRINIEGFSPLDSGSTLVINTSIERFIGFDLGFIKTKDGFSVIGYFGARLTIFPYKRKG